MLRPTLPTILTVALWTAALAPIGAQEKAAAGKPAAQAKPDASKSATQAKPETVPAAPPRPSDPNIVGTVDGKNILFTDVVARARKQSPDAFRASVAQVAGSEIANQLFGDTDKPSATLTADQVIVLLRDKPTQFIFTAFQRIVQSEAILAAATKEKISVTDPQVDAYLTKLLARLRQSGRIPTGMTDDQFLAQQKLSRAMLVEEFRPQVALDLLKEKDTELQKALTKSVEEKVGHKLTEDDYIQARHILIMSQSQSGNPADAKAADAAALAKITKIAADIKAGKKTFAAAAKESSEDPGSKATGGELGVFIRGTMVPPFEKAAFTAKSGTVVGPVKTEYGYHLIQVEKVGKELTAEQRSEARTARYQQAEQQNQPLMQDFMRNIMEKKVQVSTYLTAPAPATSGLIPGAQGG